MINKKYTGLILLILFTISSLLNAKPISTENLCENDDFYLSANTLTSVSITLKVYKHFCFKDAHGKYVLYLSERPDKKFKDDTLSTKIQAHTFLLESNRMIAMQSISDFPNQEEAGVEFLSGLTELSDIDSDGYADPIIVYRFFNMDAGEPVDDSFQGRIKIIMFHNGKKIVVRAKTGELDHERASVANEEFFKSPISIQNHLVKKMMDMYDANEFGFDNSFNFKPQKEKNNIKQPNKKH